MNIKFEFSLSILMLDLVLRNYPKALPLAALLRIQHSATRWIIWTAQQHPWIPDKSYSEVRTKYFVSSRTRSWGASSPLCWLNNKEFLCITRTVKHNYISPISTVRIQLHVSALYVGHLQVEIQLIDQLYKMCGVFCLGFGCGGGGDEISLLQ